MPSVCFYFQVHQPYRLREFRFFDIGVDNDYEDVEKKPRCDAEGGLQVLPAHERPHA